MAKRRGRLVMVFAALFIAMTSPRASSALVASIASRAGQLAATQQDLEVGQHRREVGLRCALLGHPNQIEAARQALAVLPKHLANEPLDAVACDRVADLARDRDAEPRRQIARACRCRVRALARRHTARREDQEVTELMLAPASLHPQELAPLLDSQAGWKSMRTHHEPSPNSSQLQSRVKTSQSRSGVKASQSRSGVKTSQPRSGVNTTLATKNESSGDSDGSAASAAGVPVQCPSSFGSLAAGGRAEPLATATTAGRDHLATVFSSHPRPKSVSAGPAEVVGLISTLGHFRIPGGAKGPDR